VLEMPYTGKDFSMVILLPRERDGLRNLEDSLTADAMEKWTSGLFSLAGSRCCFRNSP
jgi:serine protease inhibitor